MAGDLKIGVTGHQGLTEDTELMVRDSIATYLGTKIHIVGVTSLAEGADQIFAEEVLKAGGELEIVIPSDHYESSFESTAARSNYERVKAMAKAVIQLEFVNPSQDAYLAAGKKIADVADELIAVWDGKEAVGHGGTGDVVHYAQGIGKKVVIVWPEGASRLAKN